MAIVSYLAVASDGSLHGEVFETDKAERFSGAFCPDGGSSTRKEDLYLIKDRHWIKNTVTLNDRTGVDPGDTSSYIAISPSEAREWLKRHDFTEAVTRLFP